MSPSDEPVGTGTSTPAAHKVATTKPAKRPLKVPPKPLPPFKVLLHNDDVNEIEHVIRSIVKLTPLNSEDAVLKTLEAHHSGVALLLVTHKERAELYVDQFASLSLTVTIEQAE
ncbi:MAG TPA: ATP-dependent Clp protease adaptor ClpS [Phycisphaerae bacterium]|jgi:ATP-dependent Clp protease adaptor protein ClpS